MVAWGLIGGWMRSAYRFESPLVAKNFSNLAFHWNHERSIWITTESGRLASQYGFATNRASVNVTRQMQCWTVFTSPSYSFEGVAAAEHFDRIRELFSLFVAESHLILGSNPPYLQRHMTATRTYNSNSRVVEWRPTKPRISIEKRSIGITRPRSFSNALRWCQTLSPWYL